jgi:hypothetical protein
LNVEVKKRNRRRNPALVGLNPELPVEAIEGAGEEMEMLNVEC